MVEASIMGPEYFKDKEQLTWAEGANERWQSEHGLDPVTGDITGPLGPIPHGLGLQWQAIHDQAVWRARYRMGQEALRMSQAATGLMTSYRAGGGAALQANVYGQQAQIQLNRAQMHQPLDLLGDYRRDAMARAGRSGRTESTIGTALQGLGAVLSVIPGLNVVGLGLLAGGGALSGYGASRQAASIARAGGSGQMVSGGSGALGGFQMLGMLGMMNRAAGATNATTTDPSAVTTPSTKPNFGSTTPTQVPSQPGQSFDTAYSKVDPQAPVAGQQPGMMAGDQAQGPGQQAAGPGGMSMGGPPVVGVNGDFSPLAYAAHGAATTPVPEATQLAMSEHLAGQISDDPSWSMITMAIDRELSLRTRVA